MSRSVDLAMVREARERLREIARDHPEAFARVPTTAGELEAVLEHDTRARRGRPPSADPTVAIATRLPRSMLAELETVLQQHQAEKEGTTMQDLLRLAVRRFLAAERRKARHGEKINAAGGS